MTTPEPMSRKVCWSRCRFLCTWRGASVGILRGPVAKKSRTPPPPRRPVQAPQRRRDTRSADDRRKLLLLVAFAAAGVIALAVVIAAIALRGGSGGGSSSGDTSDGAVTAALQKVGCTVTNVKPTIYNKNETHVQSADTKVHWNTYPPAGGS